MTRFWITLEQGANFGVESLGGMHGGELFAPKIPSMQTVDLARAIGPGCELVEAGVRPGEKIHEVMISEKDSMRTVEHDDYWAIPPDFSWWHEANSGGAFCAQGFRYSSAGNTRWLSVEELRRPFEDEARG